MPLAARIGKDLQQAIKAGDRQRRDVLRMLKAALERKRIDAGSELDEAAELASLETQIKQRLEAARIFAANGAALDADRENAEAALLKEYRPPQLSEAEVRESIEAAIAALGASELRQMGAVMKKLKVSLAGRTDMKAAAEMVRERLAPSLKSGQVG